MKLRLTEDHSKEWHVDRSIGEILLRLAPSKIELVPAKPRPRMGPQRLVWQVEAIPTSPSTFRYFIRVDCLTCRTFTRVSNYTGKTGKPLHSCCGETIYTPPPEIAKQYLAKKQPRDKAKDEGELVKFLSNPSEWDGETRYERGDPK